MCLIGFLVTFLADFAARAAAQIYADYVEKPWVQPDCLEFKLLFHANIIMGVIYGIVSLLLLIPGMDKWFYSLYWDPKTFPEPKSTGRALIRQMALLLLAINWAQCIIPSNTGVGLVALCVNAMVTWNFVLLSCFDHYSNVRYWNMCGLEIRLADFYFVSSIVLTALFAVGLRRTNVFNEPWKNEDQHMQSWLFYLNMICGISYMIVGLLNFFPIYNTWFMSFYFTKLYKAHSSIEFFHRNSACLIIGIAGACLITPTNPGVGIVGFWVHLLLIFFFIAALCGIHGEIKNRSLWICWLLNAILFTALYGYALHRLNDCKADDPTCGKWHDWTDQPWETYKGLSTDSKWTGCKP